MSKPLMSLSHTIKMPLLFSFHHPPLYALYEEVFALPLIFFVVYEEVTVVPSQFVRKYLLPLFPVKGKCKTYCPCSSG